MRGSWGKQWTGMAIYLSGIHPLAVAATACHKNIA
jgi:hypothetical protein